MKLFEIMKFMAENNLDISRSDTLVELQQVKQGSIISMGSTAQILMNLTFEKHIPILFTINAKQYELLSKGITDLEKLKEVVQEK